MPHPEPINEAPQIVPPSEPVPLIEEEVEDVSGTEEQGETLTTTTDPPQEAPLVDEGSVDQPEPGILAS